MAFPVEVASLTELGSTLVGENDVGRSVYVTATQEWYRAEFPGRGADKWLQTFGIRSITSVFDSADTDVAIAASTVTIGLGGVLPTGAVVLWYIADNTESWTDGSTGTFEMDLGDSGGAGNEYADALDIDGGIATLVPAATLWVQGDADQPSVTITSNVNLSTATAGTTSVTIYYIVARGLTIPAGSR